MKIVLIKNSHVGKKGEVKDLPDPRANYLIRVGIADRASPEEDVQKVVKKEPVKRAVKKETPTKQAVKKPVKKTVKKKNDEPK